MDINVMAATALFLLLENENDDCIKRRRKERKTWVKSWLLRREMQGVGDNLFQELKFEEPFKFRRLLRMSCDTFEELVNLITPFIQKKDTVMRKAIPVHLRLSVTLRYLATGESQSSLEAQFRIAQNIISGIIMEVCNALYSVLSAEYLKCPTTEQEWKTVIEKFNNYWQFPNCFGAIVGKHVAIKPLQADGSYYFNYKGFHSIVLLALVDADYKFLYVDVGVNGRVSDGGVFNNCSLKRALDTNKIKLPDPQHLPFLNDIVPNVIVGDDAFALSIFLMKPCSGKSLSEEETIFNYRLSRARRVSENAFGILSSKFQIYQKAININCKTKIETIVLATCALHNFLRMKNLGNNCEYIAPGTIDTEDILSGRIISGDWRKNNNLINLQQVNPKAPDSAKQIRDIFKMYFNTVGEVSWQKKMCNMH